MLTGSCLCGAIRYEYTGELGDIVMCHCRHCRKAQGTAFATNSPVASRDFRLTAGQDLLSEFEFRPGKKRAFCSRCGSPIYSRLDSKPEVKRLRLGTLDTAIDQRPAYHIYAASKAEWEEIHDDLPQYPALEEARRE
jgi:hypothetical protein